MKNFIFIAVSMTCLTLGAAGVSSNEGTNAGEGKAEAGPVNGLSVAANLASMGRAAKDPVMLVTAARIKAATGGAAEDRSKESEGGTDSDKADTHADTVESLLAEAAAMAGDNEVVAALIADASAMGTKGASGGPKDHLDRVNAGSIDHYNISYNGGRTAEILIVGDGDTDLDLYVRDENGNLICEDTDLTDRMYCRWNPEWTGNFRVSIKNLGTVWNQYTLTTN